MLAIALCFAIAEGNGFLHWLGVRRATTLFVDGEMSKRLLRLRLRDEAKRSNLRPETFHAFNHEDCEEFAPLNTKEGQAIMDAEIKRIGDVDLIVFDNIMSLISGDQKDEEGWRNTMPWARSLTRRNVAQVWIHHSNDQGLTYGTKTREWQMDTVIFLEPVERPDTDVSFTLKFTKARERTPDNREQFATVNIALVDNRWIVETDKDLSEGGASLRAGRRGRGFKSKHGTERQRRAEEAYQSLANALSETEDKNTAGQRIINVAAWRERTYREGFACDISQDGRKKAFRTARGDLKEMGRVCIENDMASIVPRTTGERT
jgi:hypothetical protein